MRQQRYSAAASRDMMFATMLAGLATILALAVGSVQAQAGHGSHGAHGNTTAAAPPTAAADVAKPAEGEIRRVDAAGGRVTIKHGEIVALGMPPMTMVFRTKDPTLLQGLKVGDTVRFQAEQDGSTYYLLSVEPVR
jgi:Cu(I)/Ag(I) efflux system periplasmic protein CusF